MNLQNPPLAAPIAHANRKLTSQHLLTCVPNLNSVRKAG
jgi:hypothetical protein